MHWNTQIGVIKLLIVDDEAAVRRGLRMLLAAEPDMDVVGEAAEGASAVELAEILKPDVLLMDIEMFPMDGIAAACLLRCLVPRPAVVMLSIHDDPATRTRAEAAGAAAFVAKTGTMEALLAAIRHAGPGSRPVNRLIL